jgi:cephalosporin hydroxylase
LCLASSCGRRGKPQAAVSEVNVASDVHTDRIVRGVFPGGTGWRWTAPVFAVALDPPTASKPVFLELDFTVPEELKLPVTVTGTVNGVEVARRAYDTAGRTLLACPVPASALTRRPAAVEFSVDRTCTDPDTSRVQGIIAVSVGLKEYEQTAEYRDAEMAKARQAFNHVVEQRNLQMPAEKQRELMKVFHELPIWESLWFQNVRIIKNPLDLWMLQQIAYEVRPDFIVETGTWYGGSALWWAHTLNGLGLENARVLTVDIQDLTNKGASSNPLWRKYVEFSLGSSTDPKVVAKFVERTKNSRVIVNLDSDHSMGHVLNELQLYAPMVKAGGYIAVEDTHLDGVPTHPEQGPGPMAAVRQFLSEPAGQDFEQDFTREAMVMTSYPGGWLRRKR